MSRRAQSQTLQTEELRSLGAEERLILTVDGTLVRDEPDNWEDIEVIELEDVVSVTIDLDDEVSCVVEVEETPHPEVPVVRGAPSRRYHPVREPKRALVTAIAAGDFAGAQQALGHTPKRRVIRKSGSGRSND